MLSSFDAGHTRPVRYVNARAPVRVCDLGGWTDTWFMPPGQGRVCNIAVSPFVGVQVAVDDRAARDAPVVLDVADFGDRYGFEPGGEPGRHPLLEQTVAEMGVPGDVSIEVTVHSEMPPGCGTGTSAAVAVALIAALDGLTPLRMGPSEIARTAHRIETERLGLQSGVQDQLAAAHGGVCSIRMTEFPLAVVQPVHLPEKLAWELERRLALVFLGTAHRSSDVHQKVIARLVEAQGASAELDALRRAAERGERALVGLDLEDFGRAMIANTEAQESLHPDLVSERARQVIALAREHHASGWKVNGAGGDGGSMTVLCGPAAGDCRRLVRAVDQLGGGARVIPVALSPRGVRRWDSPA
jgi:D-glycero-alpha-D-manno-heptose-7-phosphate kinase